MAITPDDNPTWVSRSKTPVFFSRPNPVCSWDMWPIITNILRQFSCYSLYFTEVHFPWQTGIHRDFVMIGSLCLVSPKILHVLDLTLVIKKDICIYEISPSLCACQSTAVILVLCHAVLPESSFGSMILSHQHILDCHLDAAVTSTHEEGESLDHTWRGAWNTTNFPVIVSNS